MSHEPIKDDIIEESPAATTEEITPRDLMGFAKLILGAMTILFILAGISELIRPNCGIFESCKTILPPIATLVIGFYFGKSN
jgi:hypothetical protein